MNNLVKTLLKGTIIGSTMIATNEMVCGHSNPYSKTATTTTLACNIASGAVGYFVGRKVADYCVEVIDGVISGYNKEA